MPTCTGNNCAWTVIDPNTGAYGCIDSSEVTCSTRLRSFVKPLLEGQGFSKVTDSISDEAFNILSTLPLRGDGSLPSFIIDEGCEIYLAWTDKEPDLDFIASDLPDDRTLAHAVEQIKQFTSNALADLPKQGVGLEPTFTFNGKGIIRLAWVTHDF